MKPAAYWQALATIRRDLGVFHLRMVKRSTLLLSLMSLVDVPLLIKKGAGCSGYTDGRNIVVGAEVSPVEFCALYAHELQHCLQDVPDMAEVTREQFIKDLLFDEVQAKLTETEVLDELQSQGCAVAGHHRRFVETPLADRPETFRKWVRTAKASNTNKYYPQYYGELWDMTNLLQ